MRPFIKSFMDMKVAEIGAYRDWLATPLAEKIDAVVNANTYNDYDFAVVYNYEGHHYRRVIDCLDVRANEILVFFHPIGARLETEAEVLDVVDKTMEVVKNRFKEIEADMKAR